MYATCLFCNAHLGTNQVIETFPLGRRLAFDAAKGRLWVVCRKCERWNLSPLEERWEAVEDCERRFRIAKKRVASDNIGLARLDEGLELVRIGEPLRPEFAAWRYGDQFGRRRRRAIATGAAGVAVAGAVVMGGVATGVLAGGGWWVIQSVQQVAISIRRRRTVARVPTCDGATLIVRGKHLERTRLVTNSDSEEGWSLALQHAGGRAILTGSDALQATALIMPKVNRSGAAKRVVSRAVQRIEVAGDSSQFLRRSAAQEALNTRSSGTLPKLPLDSRLAIEMAVNEEHERIALEGDLALLELAWREAEEIAAIADSLTLPAEVEIRLDQLKRARNRRET